MDIVKNKTKKNLAKRLLALIIAAAFLLNTITPAWARSGNYGESNAFTMTVMGMLSGVTSSSSTGGWGTFAGNVVKDNIGSYVGLYMYINYYNDYGKPIIKFKIAGVEVDISKGQLVSMVASTVACSLAGAASGDYASVKDFGTALAKNLVVNTAELLVSETIKDVLHKKFGIDEMFAEIIGNCVGSYASKIVEVALLRSVGIITRSDVTKSGRVLSEEESQELKSTLAEIETYNAEYEAARKDFKAAKASGDTAKQADANRRMTLAKLKTGVAETNYKKKFDRAPEQLISNNMGEAIKSGLKDMGTAPMLNAATRVAVLMALGYETYKGSDHGTQANNAMKLAVADGIGGLVSARYGSQNYDKDGNPINDTSTTVTHAIGTIVTDVAWRYLLYTSGIQPDAVTALAKLAITGAVKGMVTKNPPTYEEYVKEEIKTKELQTEEQWNAKNISHDEYLLKKGVEPEKKKDGDNKRYQHPSEGSFYKDKFDKEGFVDTWSSARKDEYGTYIQSRGIEDKQGNLSYDKYATANKAMTKQEFLAKSKDNKTVNGQTYSQYMQGRSLKTQEEFNAGGYESYQDYLAKSGVMSKQEYNKNIYQQATMAGNIKTGLGRSLQSSLPYRSQDNMEYFVSSMARGQNSIQAHGQLIENSMQNVSNEMMGNSTSKLIVGKEVGKDSIPINKLSRVEINSAPPGGLAPVKSAVEPENTVEDQTRAGVDMGMDVGNHSFQ